MGKIDISKIVQGAQALYGKDKIGAAMLGTGVLLRRPTKPEEFDKLRYDKHFGGDSKELLVVQSTMIRKLAGGMLKYIKTIKEMDPDAKILLVHDSIGGSVSRSRAEREIDDEKSNQPGSEAVENSDYMKHIVATMDKYPGSIAMLLINQMTDKIGFGQKGQSRSGGHKISFHSSMILEMKKIKTLTKTVKGVEVKTGIVSSAKIDKNHLSQSEHSVNKMNVMVDARGWTSPKAVIISDTHYSLATKDLADKAWRMAVDKAAELGVPLIDAGDITNDKDMLRAQVMNIMIDTMKYAQNKGVQIYLLVGNHSLVNEKGKEHALNFLRPYAEIVDSPVYIKHINTWLLPYFSDLDALKVSLNVIAVGDCKQLIMHQGVTKAWGGHYVHDKTAAPAEWFEDFRVISGHYHRAQDIKCGRPRNGAVGLFSYIGTPYTVSFAEAGDGPKGFRILMDDGLLESVPTNLRKHVVSEWYYGDLCDSDYHDIQPGDLAWVKIKGTRSELATITKEFIGKNMGIGQDFKLDLIPTDSHTDTQSSKEDEPKMTDLEVLDKLIDGLPDDAEYKAYLKSLVAGVLE